MLTHNCTDTPPAVPREKKRLEHTDRSAAYKCANRLKQQYFFFSSGDYFTKIRVRLYSWESHVYGWSSKTRSPVDARQSPKASLRHALHPVSCQDDVSIVCLAGNQKNTNIPGWRRTVICTKTSTKMSNWTDYEISVGKNRNGPAN